MKRKLSIALALLIAAGMAGWLFHAGTKPPILLGFMGGLSGRTADLGVSGRNGAMLAVELRNRAGGIGGRKIELLIEDDQQNPEVARHAISRLIQQKVVAIIGPMTSDMAIAGVELVNTAGIPMISPTVTTNALTSRDDQFFRVSGTTRDYAKTSARYHAQVLGLKRVVIFYDLSNASYTESWSQDYSAAFEEAGGRIVKRIDYHSGKDLFFTALARRLNGESFDGILILGNSVDTAMLSQRIRHTHDKVQIMAPEWASTERLIELGGQAVEGMIVSQFIDRDSPNPTYLAFRKAYMERYSGIEPGFGGVTAFEAAQTVFDAIAKQQEGQSLKQSILAIGEFQGLQNKFRIDAHGDSFRETYIARVTNARFVKVKGQ